MEHAVWIFLNLLVFEEITKEIYGLDLEKEPNFGKIKYSNMDIVMITEKY